MSSEPELSRVRPQPSSSTTTALMLTYRPIIFLLFAGPVLLLSLPLVVATFGVLDTTTGQHTLLTLGTTALFSKLLESSIAKAAPTKEIAATSLERSRSGLLLVAFLTSALAIRFVVTPLGKALGSEAILEWSPSISIVSASRLAFGVFLLGFSVVARYIGPQSIVRCSSGPLLVNPYTRAFRIVFQNIKSTLDNPQKICHQDDPKKEKVSERQESNPRRLQLPTSTSLSAQIAISIGAGFILAFTSVIPFAREIGADNIEPEIKMTIIVSCTLSTAAQLLQTTIHRTNHEIDPTQYRSPSIGKKANLFDSLTTAVPTFLVVPFWAVFVHFENISSRWSNSLLCLIGAPVVIVLYLYAFDFGLRVLMCTTPSNIKKLVEEVSGGDVSMETFLDVILRSLLHSNDELVKELGNTSTHSSKWLDLEQEELKRNDVAVKTMANTLLHKSSVDEASPHLEDDILRLAILTHIGGPGKENVTGGSSWMKTTSSKTKGGVGSIDPYAVPITRALCAYVGGLGEALRLIVDSENKTFRDTWVLPPGALFMGGCAIRGATRWIRESINFPQRNTSLAILVPVLLKSTCKLQKNLSRYSLSIRGSKNLDETDETKMEEIMSPQLLSLFDVCNNCAMDILKIAKANEGFRRMGFMEFLDLDCQRWLRSKMPELYKSLPM